MLLLRQKEKCMKNAENMFAGLQAANLKAVSIRDVCRPEMG